MYYERALLLWPRLDRTKLRRYAHDPARIAELVERRTAQPFDREIDAAAAAAECTTALESRPGHAQRMTTRIVGDGNADDELGSLVVA